MLPLGRIVLRIYPWRGIDLIRHARQELHGLRIYLLLGLKVDVVLAIEAIVLSLY